MLYTNWLKIWLNNYVKPSVKVRTYQRYCNLVKGHVSPYFINATLKEISPLKIQQFITYLLNNGNKKNNSGLSASTVNCVISILQNSLKTAYFVGEIDGYNADKIKRPKTEEKQIECFTLIEQKKIENYVLSSKKNKLFGIVLCLYTGVRIGELLALTWDSVDLKKGLLHINKSCYDTNNGERYMRVIDTPKTKSSIRVIPLPKQLIPLLKKQKNISNCNNVVSYKNKPIFVRSYQRTFELLLKKLGIAHKGFHSLRHTFATRALECGMDVKTLSELLGHKNATVTLNRYVHSLLEHKTDMMNRLGKLL